MLVVIGIPVGVDGDPLGVTGTPARAAVAAVRAGANVELVGKVGDDPAGDAAVLALGRFGVGHAALLRDPGRRTPVLPDSPDEETSGIADESETANSTDVDRAVDRTDWPALEPEDIELALLYLPDVRVIVVAEPLPGPVLEAVTDAASYLAAPVVMVTQDATTLPTADLVIAAPDTDPDGAFAEVLGQIGTAVDRGVPIAEALAEVSGKLGLTPISA